MIELNKVYNENCQDTLARIPDEFLDCVVTSPPYFGLRDYHNPYQFGLERTPDEFVSKLVSVFREVRRALKPEGTFWLNIGDSYSGAGYHGSEHKNPGMSNNGIKGSAAKPVSNIGIPAKNLIGIPWMLAFALRADGWILRQDIIWSKTNCMPEPVKDRCTKSHEYLFLLVKQGKYYFNQMLEPTKESSYSRASRAWDGKKKLQGNHHNGFAATSRRGERFAPTNGSNKRSVWELPTANSTSDHFAVFPEKLIAPCILAGCPEGGIVYDPFGGSGTTGAVAAKYNRNFILSEINYKYASDAEKRIEKHLLQTKLF